MNDQARTKEQLIAELEELRRRVAAMEASESEWRRTEEALRESERRFRLLMESVPLSVWQTDPDGNIVDYNPYWTEFTGQMREQGKRVGWIEMLHPDDLGPVMQEMREVLAQGRLFECEFRLKRAADGTYCWHLARAVPLKDDKGTITGWIGSTTDIHGQKCAEEALRQSEQRISLHFQQTPLAAIEWDVGGRVTKWNPAAERIFGYAKEQALGQHFSVFVPQPALESVNHVAGDLFDSKGGYRSTNENITKDGRTILCDWYNTPLIDAEGQVVGAASLVQDITEQIRAEEALRTSEQQLRLALDASSAGTWSWNAGTNESTWDIRYHEIYGLGSDDPHDHSTWLSVLHPDDRSRVVARIQQMLCTPGDDVWSMEFRAIHPTLGERWHYGLGRANRDQTGKVYRMTGIDLDITDRKRAEEALKKANDELERRVEERTAELRQNRDELRTIYDGMVDGLLISEIETKRVVRANASICRMLGYSEDELVSLSIMDLHPEEEFIRILATFQLQLENGQLPTANLLMLRKDGSVFHVEATGRLMVYNSRPCVMGFFRDIAARKRAEDALRASEERYELAVRGVGVGIWDYDVQTDRVYYSPRWKQMFGFEENEIGDSLEDWIRLLHPDERDWITQFQNDFLAGQELTVTVEYRLRHKDGSYRWIVAHGLAVRDAQGRALRFVGSHGDITDRKHAEEALVREHRTLKHLLQASDHERQTIAYDIHDGLAQQLAGAVMQFQTYSHQKEERPALAAKAFDAGFTMLQQGHVEARRLIAGVRPPILDESGVVAAVGHLVNEQSRRKVPKVEYFSRVDFDRLVPILENAIYRIAQEALANACQHSKSKRVRVSLLQREDRVRIEVRDWGQGFDTKRTKGERFGLEGIRQRARLLGGKCSIRSKPGKGTCVTVELPVLERQEE
jgi:PAS domain S-box-containing protein